MLSQTTTSATEVERKTTSPPAIDLKPTTPEKMQVEAPSVDKVVTTRIGRVVREPQRLIVS
jgi:hypothetical protein